MIIGICGRQGAGKSTLAMKLTGALNYPVREWSEYRLGYIVSIIFGWRYETLLEDNLRDLLTGFQNLPRDPIWNKTLVEAANMVMTVLRRHFGPDYKITPGWIPKLVRTSGAWIECNFAETVKLIASVIFDFPDYKYDPIKMLYGVEEKYRIDRETTLCKPIGPIGSMTGRKCLEWLGTEVMRNSPEFGENIWFNIMHRTIKQYMDNKPEGFKGVVISDVRYNNERILLESLNAKFIIIYRKPEDLNKQPEDENKHPSAWEFTIFHRDIHPDNVIYIENSLALADLDSALASLALRPNC